MFCLSVIDVKLKIPQQLTRAGRVFQINVRRGAGGGEGGGGMAGVGGGGGGGGGGVRACERMCVRECVRASAYVRACELICVRACWMSYVRNDFNATNPPNRVQRVGGYR